jgi:hypothetical protein
MEVSMKSGRRRVAAAVALTGWNIFIYERWLQAFWNSWSTGSLRGLGVYSIFLLWIATSLLPWIHLGYDAWRTVQNYLGTPVVELPTYPATLRVEEERFDV